MTVEKRRKKRREADRAFGEYLRVRREALRSEDPSFSIRGMAEKLGVQHAFLRKLEAGEATLSEELCEKMAPLLQEDPRVLLARSGKVSERLKGIIVRHPKAFYELIEQLEKAPEHAILRVVREVRDGDW